MIHEWQFPGPAGHGGQATDILKARVTGSLPHSESATDWYVT